MNMDWITNRYGTRGEDTGTPMKYIIGLILLIVAIILFVMLYVGWIPSPESIVDKLVGIVRR